MLKLRFCFFGLHLSASKDFVLANLEKGHWKKIVGTKDCFCYLVQEIFGPKGWKLSGGLVGLVFQKAATFPEFAFLSNCSKCELGGFGNHSLLHAASSGMLEAQVLVFV